jgi:hypothetical protein
MQTTIPCEISLWGALMAGATGVEWYFGYRYPHNDLNLEDFRSRENWWKQSTIATQFMKTLAGRIHETGQRTGEP